MGPNLTRVGLDAKGTLKEPEPLAATNQVC
jgi:hypothetical protein